MIVRSQCRASQVGEVTQAACGAFPAALRRGVKGAVEDVQLATFAQTTEQAADERGGIAEILHTGGQHDHIEYIARQHQRVDVGSDECQPRVMAEDARGLGQFGAVDVDTADLALQGLRKQMRQPAIAAAQFENGAMPGVRL